MKVQLIIFDMDDTLLDTTSLLIPIARTPAFEDRIRQPLPLMFGAKENLEALSKKYQLALLTQGRPEAQKQKVASLGIGPYFKKMYFADPSRAESKSLFFSQALRDFSLPAGQILSIGNRRSTDIREAKKLGMQTCLFLYGEHLNDPIEVPEDRPDFEVRSHQELIKICQL
ncbi:MAG: hypothetical protein COT73_03020 [Bdellovibrio sp. CG10_big_fil_rev_8_21_14_0_10_47_8]|nr:MAG: hypothetical protein COT73_03020 [Bdellovibrio sp. CG10_big_fil_rev_8_21_14_0_10_47_8]